MNTAKQPTVLSRKGHIFGHAMLQLFWSLTQSLQGRRQNTTLRNHSETAACKHHGCKEGSTCQQDPYMFDLNTTKKNELTPKNGHTKAHQGLEKEVPSARCLSLTSHGFRAKALMRSPFPRASRSCCHSSRGSLELAVSGHMAVGQKWGNPKMAPW